MARAYVLVEELTYAEESDREDNQRTIVAVFESLADAQQRMRERAAGSVEIVPGKDDTSFGSDYIEVDKYDIATMRNSMGVDEERAYVRCSWRWSIETHDYVASSENCTRLHAS